MSVTNSALRTHHSALRTHHSALRTHHSALSLDELKSALWGAAVLLRGKINATGYKEYIFPLVFFKRISDVHKEEVEKLRVEGGEEYAEFGEYTFNIPKGCSWDDIREVTENVGQALVTAWTRIEQANPDRVVGDRVVEGLGGIFGKRDHWTNKNLLPDRTLSELIEHFSKLDLSIASCPADEMGNAYEYLVGKFADDAGNTAQEFYTNRTVVELMAEILEPKAGESIYDPTCGTGGMLISCIARCKEKCGVWSAECGVETAEPTTPPSALSTPNSLTTPPSALRTPNWREIKAYGQEQNALTSSVARMNLFLHGVEEFRIVNDDTLLRPGFLNAGQLKTFNVVLANPPYSIKQWNRELFANDPYGRNFLGTPPQGRADYAFIQHIFKSMDPKTGRCAILLPHGVLFREEEKSIRKALIEADILEAVIGLAPNLFYNSPMEACIMICRSQKQGAAKGRVLFVNAVNEVVRKNAESKLEPEHIEKILKAYRERPSDGVFSYDATNEEIVAKDYSLAISLYAHAANVTRGDAETRSLGEVLGDYISSSNSTSAALTDLAATMVGRAVPSAPQPATMVGADVLGGPQPIENEVALCAGCGAPGGRPLPLRFKFGDVAEEIRGNWNGSTEGVPVVGLEHLDPDEVWLKRWDVDPDENTFTKAFRKGQLLLGRRRVYQKKLSLAPCDGICSGDITVIAAKGDKILPELLPFYLRTDRFFDFAMQGSAGSLSPRVKWGHLADYEFDLPPIEKQQELAELLWAANDLKESYKKMIVATDEMLKAKFREMFGGGGIKCPAVDSWPLVRFEDICVRGPQNGFYRKGAEIDGRTPTLKMKQLFANESMETAIDCDCFLMTQEEIAKYRLTEDDLVFGRRSIVPDGAGKCRRVGHLQEDTVFESSMLRVTLDKQKADPRYIQTWTEWGVGAEEVAKMRSGTTIVGIKGSDLKIMPISLPPLPLQQQFVEVARKADVTKATLKKSIADVEQVIKGLING